jgi:hypothetical protein
MCQLLNLGINDFLGIISTMFILIGGVFALFQWRVSTKLKRAEYLDQIIVKLRFDKEIADTMYIIDYNYSWYNESFHGNDKLEYAIDKLLSFLNYICYLYEMKNVSKKEFKILQYELNRACISSCVQSYLWNLFHFSKKNKTDSTFQYLINYGIKNKIIKKKFYEDKNSNYIKYLNF